MASGKRTSLFSRYLPKSLSRFLVMAAVPVLLSTLSYCGSRQQAQATPPDTYAGWSDTVGYVGMNTCRQCHNEIYEQYIQTGMGRSFDLSSREKSAAIYGEHQLVYDDANDYWYRPYWRQDSLRILEFRLEGTDTVHKREETVQYIIGSGQHTNSHLLNDNGYVYQAPITFYTQKGKWDMAPGFEGGFSSRFERMIEEECMSCHNGLPQLTKGSINHYEHIPQGIDCERCHGPGEAHLQQKSLGVLVDTATAIDYSIINPGKLSVQAQLDLCQRCHLQGVAVLEEGASWDSYKPGMSLKEHWNIFLPRQSAESERFLMASQAERLRKSACFIESGGISCISCHNPHLSVKATPVARLNQPCQECHAEKGCTETLAARKLADDNCGSCHMPSSGSIDIPHVSITDHRIQVPGRKETNTDGIAGLECLTDEVAAPLTMAKGYLKFYEAFNANEEWLDSASNYLAAAERTAEWTKVAIHHAYLRNDGNGIAYLAQNLTPALLDDGWTNYRVGEGYAMTGDGETAAAFFARAVELEPLNLDFQYRKGNHLFQLGNVDAAKSTYEFILAQQARHAGANSNLGFIYLQDDQVNRAEACFKAAIAADPDHVKANLNLVQLYLMFGPREKGEELLRKLVKRFPDDPGVQALANRAGIL